MGTNRRTGFLSVLLIFKVLPRRWVVERTFAWLGRYRRLSKDYERLSERGEGMVYAASIATMVRRIVWTGNILQTGSKE
jgi:transposase